MPEKKTEAELIEEIQDEYGFEEGDERIDKILQIKKDRYTATQAKKKKEELLAKMEQGKNHYKKLAGIDPKTGKKQEEPKGKDGGETPTLSIKDQRALMSIPEEDFDDFTELAEKFKLSPAEAAKDVDLQTALKNRREMRATAEATNTGKGKRSSTKVSGEALLQKAKTKGEVPESDEDMDALLDARLKEKYS